MPEFLAETCAPGAAAPRAADIALAAGHAGQNRTAARLLGAIALPGEETCGDLLESPSAGQPAGGWLHCAASHAVHSRPHRRAWVAGEAVSPRYLRPKQRGRKAMNAIINALASGYPRRTATVYLRAWRAIVSAATRSPRSRPPFSGRAPLITLPGPSWVAGGYAACRGLRGSILRGLTVVVVALGLVGTGAVGAAVAGASTAAAAGQPATSGGPGQQAPTAGAAHQYEPKKPKPHKPPHPGPKSAPAPVDISGSMPRTMRDDLTGDFLGRGYDLRMRAEDNHLNLYEPPSRGGGQLPNPAFLDLTPTADEQGGYTPWADYAYRSAQQCYGCLQNFWSYYHLSTVYLARNNDSLFITGAHNNGDLSSYENVLYVAPADGSCASAIFVPSCLKSFVHLPSVYGPRNGDDPRIITVTSLAAGYRLGHPLLAVGLSDGGVQIYDVSNPVPRLAGTFGGMATGDGSQTPVTALAWDPAGSGLLAVGVISWSDRAFMVQVGPDGNVQSWQKSLAGATSGQLEPTVLSAAIGRDRAGNPVAAFGMDQDGKLQIFDNPPGGPTQELSPTAATGSGTGTIVAVNPIPRFDGTPGGDDFAVSYQNGSDIYHGQGALWRWDGTSAPLTPQPLSLGPNNTANTFLPDWETFRRWYPGIKEGQFSIKNASGEQISVSLHARKDPEYGCWSAPSAFPSQPVTIDPGRSSPVFTMGAYTAGPTGGCAAADATGSWRGYLVVTPVNRPADVSLVDVQLGRDMSVNVGNDQVGGSTAVSSAGSPQPAAAFGSWTITVNTPATPTALTPPTVTGQRLTAPPVDPGLPDSGLADDPHRPVYRFDVSGAQWTGVAQPNQLTSTVPAMRAQGSTDDGTTWKDLGSLMPVTAPTLSGSTVTLGAASFFWQADAGHQPLTDVRVMSGGLASAVVHLAGLTPPPTNGGPAAPAVQALSLTSAIANPANPGVAAPRANGVDQAPLNVALQPANGGGVIPTSDPRYQLVYYRDASSNELVTGLYTPGDYQDYVAVAPWRGAYPNDGLNGRPRDVSQVHAYLVTTSGLGQSLNAVLNDSGVSGSSAGGSVGVFTSSSLSALGNTARISPSGTARAGLSLGGCPAGSCTLVTPTATAPGLYQAGSATAGPSIGLMFGLAATTSQSLLPLRMTADHPQHPLAKSSITVTNNQARADPSVFWPDDTVDMTLLTAGQLISVPGVQ